MITALTSTDQNQDPSQNIPQNQIMHQNPDGEQIEQVQDREREKRQNTQCKNCFISIPFDYFGMTPPFAPKVIFFEPVYAIKDPFTSPFTIKPHQSSSYSSSSSSSSSGSYSRAASHDTDNESNMISLQLTPKRCLAMGAVCCNCSQTICLQLTCSLFYTKRFCAKCALENAQHFPSELQQDIAKLSVQNL